MGKGQKNRKTAILLLLPVLVFSLPGCSAAERTGNENDGMEEAAAADTSHYLRIISDEPDTADPQCTEGYYDIALNVFDRLVENKSEEDGSSSFVPSLADSWEISEDGLTYAFHLHKGVTFSNGSPLTSSDVEYTLKRLLTHPDSYVADSGEFILGAEELAAGKTDELEGFKAVDDLNFTITLSAPYAAFLAILSTPGASILDEETTLAAGDRFGMDPKVTVGTGSFIIDEWRKGDDMTLAANKNCWAGAPGCDGVLMRFVYDAEAQRLMFEEGKLDILDLESMGDDAEYFIRGDIYQDKLVHGRRVGLSFIALNESIEPLNDVRVRRALMLGLDRNALLMNAYSGRGELENGIYPHGLIGYNEKLPAITYDPQAAKNLLSEAGYTDGFDLELDVDDENTYYCNEIMELAAAMWKKIGVRCHIRTIKKEKFMELRKNGKIVCYTARFSVDYNDPDAIIYLFYGTPDMTKNRSLCYSNEDIMARVYDACCIVDEPRRLKEYRYLEKKIVQENCAWIPLFSNEHYFVVSDRVKNFKVFWNGWTNTRYHDVVIEDKD